MGPAILPPQHVNKTHAASHTLIHALHASLYPPHVLIITPHIPVLSYLPLEPSLSVIVLKLYHNTQPRRAALNGAKFSPRRRGFKNRFIEPALLDER